MLLVSRLLAAITLGLYVAASAPQLSPRVRHESRAVPPTGWSPVRRASGDTVIPLKVGLVQSNLASIEEFLMDVSHPDSPNYANHWTSAQVAQTFRPSAESIDTVRGWLEDNGVDSPRVKLSKGGHWLSANVTVAEAEALLGTEYYEYEHDNGHKHIACDQAYHLPEHVSKHVDLVTPTLHFDVHVGRRAPLDKRDAKIKVGSPGSGPVSPKTTGTFQNIWNELERCDEQIVPICLQALYDFIYEPLVPGKNSIGIVEYTPQAYVPSDLDMFFTNISKSQIGERPVMDSIDGGTINIPYPGGFGINGESNLDLQYSMGLVGGRQHVQLYQVGDLVEGASFNNFLDALDGSDCTFDGGDDPDQDATYPDPYQEPGAYEGPEACGTYTPAHVISTSYSYDEVQLTPAYMERQCAEYAKLGLMGVTVLYSSGDYGVAGSFGCLDSSGFPGGNIFSPTFPGTCPYITSVGATQVNPGAKVTDPESACQQVIYSGGGFSNVFPMPDYQKAAVEAYKKYIPSNYTGLYNASGSRGYPDLSANGANYAVVVQGEFYLVYGTSASSPVTASILSAVNDARLAIGKKPIGFINPTIYENMKMFNDITSGSNPGCGTQGFSAESGWDPVTGVGTPNFPKLLARWLTLP